ncbi:hypothetical protein IWQ56_005162, partial [Coemansia nantahalensis]
MENVLQMLDLLFPQYRSIYPNASQAQPSADDAAPLPSQTANMLDDVAADEARTVPSAAAAAAAPPLDSVSRRRTSPLRSQQQTSATEASRLRGRSLAAMTNEEFEARAEAAQPGLLDEMSAYADQSGFSTPHVSRTAIRQRMRTVGRAPLPGDGGAYDMPISPESSFHELRSPGGGLRSPARYAELDDGSTRHIEDLMDRKAELQRTVAEKERRIELLEGQYEKRTVALEREIDECRGQLTTKKREIERLKQTEKGYIESLQTAEGEIERIGVNLSNSTAQAAELRRQLDTKAAQLTESNQRALEYQSEIGSLKSGLGANHQQQEHLSREHRRLELQFRELEHELKTAREFRSEAAAARKENAQLNETVDMLKQELSKLRLQEQQTPSPDADDQGAAGQLRARRRYRSLQDELSTGNEPDEATGTQELGHDAVRHWIGTALGRCSAEDLVVLNEVWRRIEYCDTSTESQTELRRELVEVFMAPG